MTLVELSNLAERIERGLGDPHDPASAMPLAAILDLDEREQYPHRFVAAARRLGVHDYMIPVAHGGRAVDVQDGFNLARLIARRDPTTATAMVLTTLGFTPVWVAGSDEQRARLCELLLSGLTMGWALSERDHGSDVLANELTAERVEGGYVLNGQKWTIGNATVADALGVFARTRPKGGPGAFSILIVEKRDLDPGSWEPIPDMQLHGLRGLDMSGIRFHDAFVPERSLIGREGAGLEIALKSAQMARTTINSLALGCADTAVRAAAEFASAREIFGTRVIDIPYSRRQLAECAADILWADAVAIGSVRGLQVAPDQVSILSSVAKYLVPTLLERTISQAATVLGCRHYLREHPRYGIVQKIMRDFTVTSFADGNTVVNLKNIAFSLPALLEQGLGAEEELRARAAVRVQTLFDLEAQLPPYRPWEQELFSRGADDLILAMPSSIETLARRTAGLSSAEADAMALALTLAQRLWSELERMRDDLDTLRDRLGREFSQSAELFELAKQYCVIHAAAACLHLAVHSPDAVAVTGPGGPVLALCLERLWMQFRPADRPCDAEVVDAVAGALERLVTEGRMISFYSLPLAESMAAVPS